ncbi:hypothetical protein GGR53DRAFT_466784 [Hypoxylon sp. FL1150]|nr:hypothetical protein GGR53DRAFT_466784 [Hypoxylon sp. FL1150]
MSRGGSAPGPWNDIHNLMLLRADIRILLNRRDLVTIPKEVDGGHRYVMKVIKANRLSRYDAWLPYHNRILGDLAGIRPEYFFGRFAWNVFHGDTLHFTSAFKFQRQLRTYDEEKNTHEVGWHFVRRFCKRRARPSASGGEAEYDTHETLESSITDFDDAEEAYRERLHGLDGDYEQEKEVENVLGRMCKCLH